MLCGDFYNIGGLYINGSLVWWESDDRGPTRCGTKSINNSNSVNLSSSGDPIKNVYAEFYY